MLRTPQAGDTGIFVEETASTVVGGCVNASDRFIDGFYWLPAMAGRLEYPSSTLVVPYPSSTLVAP